MKAALTHSLTTRITRHVTEKESVAKQLSSEHRKFDEHCHSPAAHFTRGFFEQLGRFDKSYKELSNFGCGIC